MQSKVNERWKRGLLSLPAIYLIGFGAVLLLSGLKTRIKSVQLEVNSVLAVSDEAFENKDIPAIKQANDELDILVEKMKKTRLLVFSLTGSMLVILAVFCRSIWLITTAAESRMETYARWSMFALPILLLGAVLESQGDKWELISKAITLVIAIGQQHALIKIGRVTGQFRLMKRIDKVHQFYFFVLVGAVGLAFLLGILDAAQQFGSLIMPLVYIGFGVGTVVLSQSVWQLRRGIF